MEPVSLRAKFRAHVRDEALDACYGLAVERGWAQMRLSDVAAAIGVSRPTLYKEFGSKDGLAAALVRRETERFLVGVKATLDEFDGDIARALTEAVRFSLGAAEANPLLHAVLTSSRVGDDALLPMLTTRSAPIHDAASATLTTWFAANCPTYDPRTVHEIADVIVRLTVSYLMLPAADRCASARLLAEVAVRYLRCAQTESAPT